MKPEEKYKDDLDYLSQLGYEKVPVSDADLTDLKRKIKSRYGSGSNIFLILGSLAVGILIGIALFFSFFRPVSESSFKKAKISNITLDENAEIERAIINLDTILIVKENFINPSAKSIKSPEAKRVGVSGFTDSIDIIAAKPIDLSLLKNGEIRAEKLKYIINSPVFYLHDMKVTNYTTLYFKKNQFVNFSGLSAAYSGTNEISQSGSRLKTESKHYLHEEIATAMLNFRSGKYDEALNSLNTVSSYNKNDLNCDFYLAMCYYYKKNYAKAASFFDLCIANSNNAFLQEAQYYKALSLYESGDREEASDLLQKIADENEFYAEKARAYLKD